MSPTSDTGGRSIEYAPELDGVRGLAILLVLIWHYYMLQAVVTPGSALMWISYAGLLSWSGVDLFFVLSGYLLGSILIRNRGAECYYNMFYIRRACRILPLYALLLFAYLVFSAWLYPSANPGLRWLFERPEPFWTYATFTQNFAMALDLPLRAHFLAVTWSLAIEEQFYLGLPLLIALVRPRQLPWVLAILIALAPALRWVASSGGSELMVPMRMDSLLGGALLATLMQHADTRAWLQSRLSLLRLLFAVALAGIVLMSGLQVRLGAFKLTWLAVFYVLLIALALLERGALRSLLRQRWLMGLGAISYSVYLFHQPVSGLLHAAVLAQRPMVYGWASAGVTVAALAITVAIGVLTRLIIERPALEWGRRFNGSGETMTKLLAQRFR